MPRQKTLRLLSWNLAGRVKLAPRQLEAIGEREPDVVALQEVTQRTAPILWDGLTEMGFPHVEVSFYLGAKKPGMKSSLRVVEAIRAFRARRTSKIMRGPRRYGQIVASRWPLKRQSASHFTLPWPERLL